MTRLGGSPALEVLAPHFHALQAQRRSGRAAWLNPPLAGSLGFEVQDQVRTPALEQAVLEATCFTLPDDQSPSGAEEITVHADHYGGTGMGDNRGSGRAAFLPYGNLVVKGIGPTPLATADPDDPSHSHGGAGFREGLLEAIWGEVNDNLFSAGSTRVLAVVDLEVDQVLPDGSRFPRALIIRSGAQLRPAHVLEPVGGAVADALTLFQRAAQEAGCLKRRPDGELDLNATTLELIDRHARTAAEQFRYRVLHGSISTSNIELSGAQLDLATQTAQPRTAAVWSSEICAAFGHEHRARAEELFWMHGALLKQLGPSGRQRCNGKVMHFGVEMERAYQQHLDREVLRAAGLKPSLAQQLADQDRALARELSSVVRELASLSQPGGLAIQYEVDPHACPVDVFNLLRRYARRYFDGDGGHQTERELLEVELRDPSLEVQLEEQIGRFTRAYAAAMERAVQSADGYYADETELRREVIARAEFENAPLDALYAPVLKARLDQRIEEYLLHRDPDLLRQTVDQVVGASLRDVDRLAQSGRSHRLEGGGLETGARSLAGVSYAVRCSAEGEKSIRVRLPASAALAPSATADSEPSAMVYRYTLDGWRTVHEARLVREAEGGVEWLRADLPLSLQTCAGRLEGLFRTEEDPPRWIKDLGVNFPGYAFGVPDSVERARLVRTLAQSSAGNESSVALWTVEGTSGSSPNRT